MTAPETSQKVEIPCADGVVLGGNFWRPAGEPEAVVVINAATGVLARYYHRYARWLADEGFSVLTYDYRGIGASRPRDIRNCGYHWREREKGGGNNLQVNESFSGKGTRWRGN